MSRFNQRRKKFEQDFVRGDRQSRRWYLGQTTLHRLVELDLKYLVEYKACFKFIFATVPRTVNSLPLITNKIWFLATQVAEIDGWDLKQIRQVLVRNPRVLTFGHSSIMFSIIERISCRSCSESGTLLNWRNIKRLKCIICIRQGCFSNKQLLKNLYPLNNWSCESTIVTC
jgi:hypothetical protein